MKDFPSLPPQVSTAALTDALGRLSTDRVHVLDLVTPTPGRLLRGEAVTMRFVPFRKDLHDAQVNNFARLFYEAVGDDPTGLVLVLDSGGQPHVSVGGGMKLSRLHNHQLAGLLTEGRLRDFGELKDYDPVFYCGGETVKAGTADLIPVAANVPVVIGGVTVLPGDFVYADAAGAVIIPSALVDEAFRLAITIEHEEATTLKRISAEEQGAKRAGGH
ncbi:RraA family protein [Arthrobacter sp. ISL-85]|uniref:RraA family protein n=1 Tax=Arthrobacter sp. ISL-85 TaxID=2819115 RepID=UPI001BE6C36B|nr:RraA family protein [Arthrobacter sp. ISL-85]MBT2566347.1 RraA family protein [Arthrobacter sp. ISL-85]